MIQVRIYHCSRSILFRQLHVFASISLGLSVILDKCTLRDSNSYPLQQALRRGEGFFLFPHIQLMKHTDNLLTSDHLNFNENQANKKVNKVQLLQSAVDSFKSHLLTNHFQIAPSQFLDNLNNSLQGNNKLLIEPTLTAVKSITFPFQKLGIFLNQVRFIAHCNFSLSSTLYFANTSF